MRIVLRAYCCICRSLNTRIHCEQYACNALPRVLSNASQTMDMPFSSTVRLSSLATALPFANSYPFSRPTGRRFEDFQTRNSACGDHIDLARVIGFRAFGLVAQLFVLVLALAYLRPRLA